ncbi:MAG: WYL domain-containing protein [Myxococcales bacterium]|nr:WYL domain-containing protein [Myxococcales bacterium]
MPRGDSLARQLQLLQILDDRREIAVPEVAERLGYTARTVYRDLLVLERVGVPIYREAQGRRARWRVVEGYSRKLSLTLSFPEMLALTAGRELLAGLSGTLFHEAAISGLEKIRAALPRPLVERADAAARRLSAEVGGRDYSARGALLERLVQALEERRTVRLRYRKAGAKRAGEREVDPYHLHLHAGGVYLIGWCHRSRAVRTFLLERVAEVEVLAGRFEPREQVSLGEQVQGVFGPWSGEAEAIALRFSPEVAPLIAERKVHPSQSSQWASDGTLDVKMKAPLAPALVRWVVGLGPEVVVLGPKALAKTVREAHRRAVGLP